MYPSGTSTFRYLDDETGKWTTFKSVLEGDRLTLSADAPARVPLLYRVGRAARPTSIRLSGQSVLVNQGAGTLPELETEDEVNESPVSAWHYDEAAQRLIVKIVP